MIPKRMREALGIGDGDQVLIWVDGGRLVITSPRAYAKSTRGLTRGTWTRRRGDASRYVERERQAWR
ncbi:MAG: AbrB/MazE/SpoVT family DNA-binding domain-containing protein [Candidatus Rokubacteria bacterium]|nr:AbrB/MazE/SpoVT family DNA-binding domain-containing protein [Candidatus Rokubacteria bacterium]MBI3826042.1 AbrB/MazE/SpoVT family DNA-binding domain-containing protein [Candidatus Rokubacteria bacterium]